MSTWPRTPAAPLPPACAILWAWCGQGALLVADDVGDVIWRVTPAL